MIVINISLGSRRATLLLFVLELLNSLLIIILAQAISMCWHVAEFFLVLMWGPHFCGAPVRPNMLNMPKSASEYAVQPQRQIGGEIIICSRAVLRWGRGHVPPRFTCFPRFKS